MGATKVKKVYILHGWTYSLDKWTGFCEQLRAAGYDPVQLRVPGLTAPSKKVWDIDGYVEWLTQALKDEKHPVVIGHSNGGRIALAYAQKYPDHIEQLILIDSAGVVDNDFIRKAKLKTLRGLSKAGKPLAKIPGVKKVAYKLIGAQDYRDALPNMKQTMQHMLDANKHIKLKQINVPSTLIWGRDDSYTPLSDGQTMANELPHATLHIIDGARHAPFFTHTPQTVKLVVEALRK